MLDVSQLSRTAISQMRSEAHKTVYATSDYDAFSFLDANRDINKAHVGALVNSMEVRYLTSVIIVNERMQIIDGQHRFEACRELGLPIYYIIEEGYGLPEVQRYNSTNRTWRAQERLESFCKRGFPHYIALKEFMEDAPELSFAAARFILGKDGVLKSRRIKDEFDAGLWEVGDLERAHDIVNKLRKVGEYYKGFRRVTFIQALVRLLDTEEFDFDKFINKLSYQPTKLLPTNVITEYIDQIEDIYNYNSSKKVSFKYL